MCSLGDPHLYRDEESLRGCPIASVRLGDFLLLPLSFLGLMLCEALYGGIRHGSSVMSECGFRLRFPGWVSSERAESYPQFDEIRSPIRGEIRSPIREGRTWRGHQVFRDDLVKFKNRNPHQASELSAVTCAQSCVHLNGLCADFPEVSKQVQY